MASTTYSTDPIILKSLFVKYDKDGSGEIDSSELHHLFGDLGLHPSPIELKALLMLIDRDGSGDVSYDEFYKWWSKLASTASFPHIDQKIKMIHYVAALFWNQGCTANGSLSNQAFQRVYQTLYDNYHAAWPQAYGAQMPTPEEAVRGLDADGDGQIIFYELMSWLNWM